MNNDDVWQCAKVVAAAPDVRLCLHACRTVITYPCGEAWQKKVAMRASGSGLDPF